VGLWGLQWEAVLPQVKQECAQKWPNDYDMQAYCIRKQKKAPNTSTRSLPECFQPPPA